VPDGDVVVEAGDYGVRGRDVVVERSGDGLANAPRAVWKHGVVVRAVCDAVEGRRPIDASVRDDVFDE
jgi:hypothetical protein